MTFTEIVAEVADRLNLTSSAAMIRIGKYVNKRYRWVTSGIGLQTSRRVVLDVEIDPTDVGSTLPEYTFTDIEKILKITMTADNGGVTVLKEKTYDEITMIGTISRLPRSWAVKRMGSGEVIVVFDSFPATDTFTVHVEGYEIPEVLEDDMEPYLPASFHDILVEGAMSDEYMKMEKPGMAQAAEAIFTQRYSDLRMFIATSAWKDIAQGKDKPGQLWFRQWFSRVSIWN